MGAIASQITSHSIVYSTVYLAQIKETSKFRVTGLCEGNPPVAMDYPHNGPVTLKMFQFDDVIIVYLLR